MILLIFFKWVEILWALPIWGNSYDVEFTDLFCTLTSVGAHVYMSREQ